MTPTEFCYWLQGLLECGNPESLTKEQTAMVKEHLQTVFKKVTQPLAPPPVPLPFHPNHHFGPSPMEMTHGDSETICHVSDGETTYCASNERKFC